MVWQGRAGIAGILCWAFKRWHCLGKRRCFCNWYNSDNGKVFVRANSNFQRAALSGISVALHTVDLYRPGPQTYLSLYPCHQHWKRWRKRSFLCEKGLWRTGGLDPQWWPLLANRGPHEPKAPLKSDFGECQPTCSITTTSCQRLRCGACWGSKILTLSKATCMTYYRSQ